MESSPPLGPDAAAAGERVVCVNRAAAGVLPHPYPRRARRADRRPNAGGRLRDCPRRIASAGIPRARRPFHRRERDDIAFLRNTGDGANTIARGLDWRAGDDIVVCDNEFKSNVLPWLAAREAGAVVRFISTPQQRMTPDVLARAMTPRTRVVAVSWVSFADGYRHDLAALSKVAYEAGALFCVDAIAGLGAFPLDVRALAIDALYAGGAKWLLALAGVSLLYVSPALRERLHVRWHGWRDGADILDDFNYDQPLAPNAARYEGGTQNLLGIAALDASLAVLAEAGLERIGAHPLALTDRLVDGLAAGGAVIATPRGEGISSGIVTFSLPGRDPVEFGRGARPTRFRDDVSPEGRARFAARLQYGKRDRRLPRGARVIRRRVADVVC